MTTAMVTYHVFINHFLNDEEHTLADNICNTLHGLGLEVFLDKEDLEPDDFIPSEIEEAMRTSFLHIAILSPNYAHSPWSLAVLSSMLKTGYKVVPVFYNVEPGNVRGINEGNGIYADAFSQYERQNIYTSNKLEEWKRALRNVSFLSGHIIKNAKDEGRVLKSFVNRLVEMNKVVIHPLGLEETIDDLEEATIESMASHEGIQIVGIVGPGGSGKTTLAKEFYRKKCSMVKRSSFLSHVRSTAAENALMNLQKKLLGDLLPNSLVKDLPFYSVNDGKIIVASRLRSVSVLLVLDDVDHVDQLDALLPGKENLASGSLIIVTTRHEHVLTSWGIFSIYKMEGLHAWHAEQLLCWHAFLRSSPPEGFENAIPKLLKECRGLPLSIKVLGGQLYGEDKFFWDAQGNKRYSLQVSFDALDPEEQEIFLDLACFFIGEEKSLAFAVWDGLGHDIMHIWEMLVGKCLVELDENNRIRMHDELRDLGKEIAISRSPYRFWSLQQIVDIQARDKMGIRGIMAATSQFIVCSAHEEFPTYSAYYQPPFEIFMELIENPSRSSTSLPESSHKSELSEKSSRTWKTPPVSSIGLYYLVVRGADFTEEYATLSEDLIWLRWFDFNHSSLPRLLSLKNLRVLELYGALRLKELWKDNASVPLELRELIISSSWGSSFEMFPRSISELTHLRKIALISYLGDEFRIQRLPEEFCLLQSLEHLELRHCKSLLSLPARFGDLTSLRHLNLCSCQSLRKLPSSFKHLTKLQYLNLSGCRKLDLSSHILGNITKLENLYLSGCFKLQELPNITNQACLRQLHLQDTNLRDIQSNINQLSKLQVLTIGSPLLKSLPDSFQYLSSLNSFSIIDCIDLKSLPASLEGLNLLEYFCIKSSGVTSLPIWHLTNLKTLKICDCPISELDFGLERSMKELISINLTQIPVKSISISEHCCPLLEILQLKQNDRLEEIESLPTKVKIIQLSDCRVLNDISGIQARNLEIVEVSGCPQLDTFRIRQFLR